MSGYKAPPGAKTSVGALNGPRNDDAFWDSDLNYLAAPPLKATVEIRIVGGYYEIPLHWLNFISPKNGKLKRFQVVCTNWNFTAGERDENGNCPFCEKLHKNIQVPDNRSWLRMPVTTRYLFHAFDVSKLDRGETTAYFGLVPANFFSIQNIQDAEDANKGNPVNHPDKGVTLHWKCKPSTNPQISQEFTFAKGDARPVKWFDSENGPGFWGIRSLTGKGFRGFEQDVVSNLHLLTAEQLDRKLAALKVWDYLGEAMGTTRVFASAEPQPAPPPPQQYAPPPQQYAPPQQPAAPAAPPAPPQPEVAPQETNWDDMAGDAGVEENWDMPAQEPAPQQEVASDPGGFDAFDGGFDAEPSPPAPADNGQPAQAPAPEPQQMAPGSGDQNWDLDPELEMDWDG